MTKTPEQPIEERFREQMNSLGKLLDQAFNPTWPKRIGFALLVFPFGDDPGRMNYLSNSERKDMIAAMKEFIARAEGKMGPEEPLQ